MSNTRNDSLITILARMESERNARSERREYVRRAVRSLRGSCTPNYAARRLAELEGEARALGVW